LLRQLPFKNVDTSAHYHMSSGQHTERHCNTLQRTVYSMPSAPTFSLHCSKRALQCSTATATHYMHCNYNTLHIECLPTLEQAHFTAPPPLFSRGLAVTHYATLQNTTCTMSACTGASARCTAPPPLSSRGPAATHCNTLHNNIYRMSTCTGASARCTAPPPPLLSRGPAAIMAAR